LRLILIGLIILCGFFVYGYSSRLARLSAARAEITSKQAMVDAALRKNAELQAYLDTVRSGTYVDEIVRPILDYVLPGDVATTIVKTTLPAAVAVAPSAETIAAPTGPRGMTPVWQQWVELFTAETSPLQ
jgi:hypothetical protein